MNAPVLLLASASPRRAELLDQIGLPYICQPADIDETPRSGEHPTDYVQRMAREKASRVQSGLDAQRPAPVIIGADTTVVVDDAMLAKPENAADGQQMLLTLSGRSHLVLTGLCVMRGSDSRVQAVQSQVWFRQLSAAEAQAYWATGEPADKAGGYGIQGIGGIFISKIVGSYSNIVGLPVQEVEAALVALGVNTWDLRG